MPKRRNSTSQPADRENIFRLAVTALGIVFGDIGTSPLYTMKTVITLLGGTPDHATALGLLSLIIWTLLIVTTIKYVTFVLRADNDGEGGIMALMSLLLHKKGHRKAIIFVGLFGAALIYGDGTITPAISVLSAIEGLKIAMPHLTPYIMPASVAVLVLLFAFQFFGTTRIGWVFGPIMMLWFVTLGVLGIRGILEYPAVFEAVNPWFGIQFILHGGLPAFLALSGVFLCVTGAEALYADIGQVGVKAIRLSWYAFVFPALLLNYCGQTAVLLAGGQSADNIFYRMCPQGLLIPLIVLATLSTIIASQAIISGVFSMTQQAIQLGWLPQLKITQTSAEGRGQIYIRSMNWILMTVTVGLVISFKDSDHLAGAYGIAISLTMLATTALLFMAMREIWKWNLALSVVVSGVFFCVEAMFVLANLAKVMHGGWFPLIFAAAIYTLMMTWHKGRTLVSKKLTVLAEPVSEFMAWIAKAKIPRVPGTAVFLTNVTREIPPPIVWHVMTNHALDERVIALTITKEKIPRINPEKRLAITKLAPGFWRVVAHYGFMERPQAMDILREAVEAGCDVNLEKAIFHVGKVTILQRKDRKGMPGWQEGLYALMRRNCAHISDFLDLPHDRVIEIGRQIEV